MLFLIRRPRVLRSLGDQGIATVGARRTIGFAHDEAPRGGDCDGQDEHRAGTNGDCRNHEDRGI